MSQFAIRRAAEHDAAELARLVSQLGYPAQEDTIRTRLRRMMESPLDCVLVAEAPDGGLAGWIHGFLCQLLESDFRAEIGGLLVDERWRRHGLGRRLAQALEEWASEQGALELSVRCRVERAEAHQFYESLQFRAVKNQRVFRKRIGTGKNPPSP